MSVIATLAATSISLAGLGWLNVTDPKRLRAFGLPPRAAPTLAAWTLVLLPGMLVPFWSGGAGFVLWLGATSVVGWALVAVPPGRGVPLAGWVRPAMDRVRAALNTAALRRGWNGLLSAISARAAALPRGGQAPSYNYVKALEARIAHLEAEVADLHLRFKRQGIAESMPEDEVRLGLASNRGW